MNQNNTEPTPQEEIPKKKKRGNPILFTLRTIIRIIAAIVTLLLVIGAVLLIAYRDELNLETLSHYLTYSQLGGEDGEMSSFVHAGGDKMDFCRIDTGAVMVSTTGGHYYSLSGENYAEAVSNLTIPVLNHSDNTAVVYDGGGQSLYLFSDYKTTFSLSLNDGEELLSARLNAKNWLAVTAQLSGYKGSVLVYDSNQQLTMEINRSSSFIMDAALSPDCKTVAVVTIGQSSGVFQSDLLFYTVGEEEPTTTISLGDVVVLDMDYESDRLWIVTDRALLSTAKDGSDLTTYSYGQYHLKGYTLGGDGFAALLFSEYESGDPNLLVSLGADGTALGTQSLMGEVPDIDGNGAYLSVLSGDGLTVYTSTLTQYAHLEDSQGAQALAQCDDGTVLLAGTQLAWIFIPEN